MTEQLKALVDKWSEAKAKEKSAGAERYNIECEIYELVKDQLKESGTNNFEEVGLKILTGYNENWDQAALSILSKEMLPEVFPFKTEFKPDRKALDFLKERLPVDYNKVVVALTLKPKKPSFSVKGGEDDAN